MKAFHCDSCGQRVFFENTSCVRCGHALAFTSDTLDMVALEATGSLWRSLAPQATDRRYRLCANYPAGICNWAVPENDPEALCRSCRLTRIIPDLSQPENQEAWRKLEAAKRRLLYSLLHLGLPLKNRQEDPATGLAFEFLSDAATQADSHVMTGHDSGVITINIAEADDAEREKRRQQLHEPYRTLLGHFRHESGHYYWDLLLGSSQRIAAFRTGFGDEREDYAAALQRHYEQGTRPDWQNFFISAYASTHPWEDWAETWAHYLHMTDALETAASNGITIAQPATSRSVATTTMAGDDIRNTSFETLLEHWLQLAFVLNDLSRSLGLPDGYPFVIPQAAVQKLRFTHDLVRSLRFVTTAM